MGKNPPEEFQVVGRAPLSMPPDYKLRPPAPGTTRPQEQSPGVAARAAVLGAAAGPAPTQAPAPRPADNLQTASVAPVNDPPRPVAAPRTPVAASTLGTAAPPPVTTAAYVTSGILGRSATGSALAPVAASPAPTPAAATVAASDQPSTGEQALMSRLGADKSLPNIRSVLTEELTKLAEADQSTIDKLLWWRKATAPSKVLDASMESQRLQENAALGKTTTEGDSPSIKRVNKSFI